MLSTWNSVRQGHAKAVCGLIYCAAVAAQAAAPPSTDEQLQEVIVTAQKRQERLQDIPISAQVISGQVQAEQNVNSLDTLAETVPDVHIGAAGRSDELFVRGIGSGVNQSFDQSVGTFIDDVYHGRSRTSAGTFLDLDHVEILKGPQSTFFGNNAIAGALNVVTKKPTQDFDASARVLYGMFGQYAVEAAVGGPLSDTLSVRVAGIGDGQRGWVQNLNTGRYQPEEDNQAGRITFLFAPSHDFDATLKIESSENENHSGLYLQNVNCPPARPFTASGFCSVAVADGVPSGLDSNLNSENGGQELHLASNDLALTLDYRGLGPTLTSVSGFYGYHYNLSLDSDGTPMDLLNAQVPEHYTQFSQELRVTSSPDLPVSYVAGAYYQQDDLEFRQAFSYFFLSPLLEGVPPLAPYLPLGQQIDYAQNEHVYSLFGALDWHLSDQLKLNTGLRGTWVRKSMDWSLFYGQATAEYGGIVPYPAALNPIAATLGLGEPGDLSGSRLDHALMPSTNLQWKVSADVMAYLSYTRGFKAGGFNGADTTDSVQNMAYAPEHVNAYEGGVKTEWLDGRSIVNLAVFRSDYSDLQVASDLANTAGTFVSVVRNAGSSLSQGVELESQWLATRELRFSANVSYLDAHYVSYPNVPATALQRLEGLTVQDLSGQPTQYAPRWTASLVGNYTELLPGEYRLVTELSAFTSSWYFSSETGTNDPLHVQPGYARLDARVSLESPDRHWALDLIGKNLSDRTIASFIADYPTANGSTLEERQPPRNVAVQVRYHW